MTPRLLITAAYAALAALTVAIVRDDPVLAPTGESIASLTLVVGGGACAAGAAALVWRPGSRFAPWLGLAALAWLAPEWTTPSAGPAFGIGLMAGAAWPALLAAAALRGLDERPPGRGGSLLVGAALFAGVLVLGAAATAVFDPGGQGCTLCPANPFVVVGDADLWRAINRTGMVLTVVWAAAFAAFAGVRMVRASAAGLRLTAPVLFPAAIAIALYAAQAAHGLDRGYFGVDAVDRTLRAAQGAELACVGAGVALARLRTRRTRATLARLVLELGSAPGPGELRARLAHSLDDPTLALLHRLEDGSWVDGEGRPAPLPAHGRTLVRAHGADVLAVLHRPGLLDDPALLAELARTAGLALEHERLQALRRARLAELRASRARIVATADGERRALERDLHDGAQQRLVALALNVRLVRRRVADPELGARLGRVEERLRAAAVELREIAHGLFPAVLADDGLAAALDVLSEQMPRLQPRRVPEGRFPEAVESAAYFAAIEALRMADEGVLLDGAADDGHLRVVIRSRGLAELDMTQIHDRVGAVGGTVVTSKGELCLEMPCAS